MKQIKAKHLYFWMPVAAGMILLPFPLAGDFHIESAIIASLIGAFWAGVRGCRKTERSDFRSALFIAGMLYLAGTPLLVYAVTSGCFSWHGLGFWLLYPLPGVYFGYSIGRLLKIWEIPYKRTLTVIILITVAVGGLLVEFFALPQVYFFNHVWGGWPGPIYDEAIQLDGSLLFFRSITAGWILLLWFIPHFQQSKETKWIVVFSILFLLISYANLAEMRIITPGAYLQEQFDTKIETSHFKIYYDRRYYDSDYAEMISREHEFYFKEITGILEIEWPDEKDKIVSYLYAHPWQKKKRVGAKHTSYVPVWLERDQLHISRPQIGSLKHELVHVLAKGFGNDLFHASWSIGLVEGLAVAVAPDRSPNSTIDQLVASEKPYPTAREMESALSFSGFYSGRSAVNYVTAGSFVQHLLENYPARNLKEAYRSGDPEMSYPVPFDTLVERWHRKLDRTPVDTLDRKIASRLFARPSIFEKECPHVISEFDMIRDRYRYHLAEEDTLAAVEKLKKLRDLESGDPSIKENLLYYLLRLGRVDEALDRYTPSDTTTRLRLLYADAFRISGDTSRALSLVREVIRSRIEKPGSVADDAIAIRIDPDQWSRHLRLAYGDRLPSSEVFENLYYRTKVRAVNNAIKQRKWSYVEQYGAVLSRQPVDVQYFDLYLDLVHWLAFKGKNELAKKWINKLRQADTRLRQQERINQEQAWLNYLEEIDG